MYNETNGGWEKYEGNPVLGGKLETCFDISVLKENDTYRMYFSWRPQKCIALAESKDGLNWNEPVIVVGPREETGWEKVISRVVVIKKDGKYLMWYTGQAGDDVAKWDDWCSWIGYAESADGVNWTRLDKPVITFEKPWEKHAVMCPHVNWDEDMKLFRMWYSGGEQYEPNAIGYATSKDGINWIKYENNPIFMADPKVQWEQERVAACQVVQKDGWHLMFYIGYENVDTARIGIARSRDGITGWERLKANPIISSGLDKWDGEACYKPYALYEKDKDRWILWYNGRKGNLEQIGVVYHKGENLGF